MLQDDSENGRVKASENLLLHKSNENPEKTVRISFFFFYMCKELKEIMSAKVTKGKCMNKDSPNREY